MDSSRGGGNKIERVGNPSAIDIVRDYLVKHGFDGLYVEDSNTGVSCGCGVDDLAPCGEIYQDCIAAYRLGNVYGGFSSTDTEEYRRKNLVELAHTKIGLCKHCRWFRPGDEILNGLVETNDSCARSITPDGRNIYVYPDFGCIMWELRHGLISE